MPCCAHSFAPRRRRQRRDLGQQVVAGLRARIPEDHGAELREDHELTADDLDDQRVRREHGVLGGALPKGLQVDLAFEVRRLEAPGFRGIEHA